MGHVRRARSGRGWEARYRDPAGRERSRSFPTKREAQRHLASAEVSKARGEWADPRLARLTFGEWADRWLGTSVHLKPKTRASYESVLERHLQPRFGRISIGSIDHTAIRALVGELEAAGKRPGTAHNVVTVARNVFGTAIRSGALRVNPCDGLRLSRSASSDMRFLDADQVAALVDEMSAPYRLPVLFDAYMGLRSGELWALRVGRVDLMRRRIEVAETVTEVHGRHVWGPTKTYERRSVPVPRFLADLLAEHLAAAGRADDPDALVFTTPTGGVVRQSNFYRRTWAPGCVAAGLGELVRDEATGRRRYEGLRFHDLRHTCAALLIAEGAHPKAIQERLGHSSITVTLDRYGHLFPSIDEALSDRLDALYRRSSDGRPQGAVIAARSLGSTARQ